MKLKVSKDKQPIKYRKTRVVGQLNGITNIDLAVPRSFPELSAGTREPAGVKPTNLAICVPTLHSTLRRVMEIFLISQPYRYRSVDTNNR